MAYNLIAHNKAASSDTVSVTVNLGDTTGADLLVATVGLFDAGTFTSGDISDNKGNPSWSITSFVTTALSTEILLFFMRPTTVGAGHTVTFNRGGGATFPAMAASAWAASVFNPGDVHAENTAEPGATVALSLAQPTEDNSLIVTGMATGTISVIQSIDQSFSILDTVDWSSGVNLGVGLAYKIQTTKQAETPTWTMNQSGNYAAAIQALKASAVAELQVLLGEPTVGGSVF